MWTAQGWFIVLGFGAMLGAAGQVIRAVAGMKKLNDSAQQDATSVSQLFSASQLVVSVLIGAVAGLLGAISLGINPNAEIPVDKVVALLGIGYAGADFIEAFMAKAGGSAKVLPALQPPQTGAGVPTEAGVSAGTASSPKAVG